ncbi:MAG: hypothetical protein WAN36_07200, partial [Calditrichia bacterium]
MMSKRVPGILLAICMLFSASLAQSKFSERLWNEIIEATPDNSPVRALVLLKDRVDIQALDQQLYQENATLQKRAYRVITTLQAKADATQLPLLSYLQSRSADDVVQFRAFWIANLFLVEAVPSVLMEISERDEIEFLDLDALLQWDEPVSRRPASPNSINGSEPGLKVIQADKMWEAGYTGNGIIVMNIDTGVDPTHPAISYKWRGNHVPPSQAWLDPGGGSTSPSDCDNHGTH